MSIAALSGLFGFAFVTTVTPGPNNLMLMASGANFGFRRTMPHMFGITGGMAIMVLVVGAGLMTIFEALPTLNTVLEILSICYLLWLACKIATAAPIKDRAATSRPMSMVQAALFQWVNPKAWAMCLSAITLFAPDRSLVSVGIVALAFAIVCMPAISVWAWFGTMVRQWLSTANRFRAFNVTMAVMLIASLYPVLFLHH